MAASAHRALVLGCHGGVGSAVLALLGNSEPGRRIRAGLDALFLADSQPFAQPPPLRDAQVLPPTRIESAEDLGRLVRDHGVTQVIDVSSINTVDCTYICDELGADFLCTSVEEWAGGPPVSTDEAIARLIPPRRPALIRRGHLVGSGANPGIVNALVFAAMKELAERCQVAPTLEALDVHAVLITEDDTTSEIGAPASDDIFPMTWSPVHCLEEIFEPRAFYAKNGRIVELGHRPDRQLYRARCGDREIEGMAIPHEETVTLAWRFPGVEIAFLYRIAPAAMDALAAHPERGNPANWSVHRLYPPFCNGLRGQDRVGVLLCSRSFGELWLGFDTDVGKGFPFGTNATQLQVATGVLAGWEQLGTRTGIHFVEDLDWRQFLASVYEVLGSPIVVHDPDARPRNLVDRAV